MGAIGSILGSVGQYWQAYMGARSARQQANYNAKIALQKAELVESAKATETTEAHEQARKFKSSQRAAFSKSGAEMTSGTPLAIMVEQAGDIEMDILNMRRNRSLEVQSLKEQASQFRYQGKLAIRGAGASAVGTTMSLAGNLYDKYKNTQGSQPSTYSSNVEFYKGSEYETMDASLYGNDAGTLMS